MAAPARQSMRDRMREQAEKAVQGGSRYIKIPEGKKVNWFTPKEKDDGYAIDFVPYEVSVDNHPKGMRPGDLWTQRSFKVHYNVGPAQEAHICLKTFGKKCPVCDERASMASDPNLTKAEEKLMDDMKPKDRTLYQLIDLDDEKKGVQLWDYSYFLFEKRLLSDINKTEHAAPGRKKGTAHGGYGELKGGQTLTLSFIKKANPGFNPFFECDRIDAEDRQDYGEEILDETLDLDTILEELSYEKLRSIMLAVDEKKEAATEDAPKGRGRGKADPEPEPEPEPAGRGRGRGKTADPEPDPEPPPTRRGRAAAADPEPEPEAPPAGRRGRGAAAAEPEPEAPPARRGRGAAAAEEEAPPARPARKAASDDPECPAFQGVFGKDSQTHDACYDCPDATWKACQERNIELKKK